MQISHINLLAEISRLTLNIKATKKVN